MGHHHTAGAGVLERAGNGMQIAHAVIDYGNRCTHSTPLVEGVTPAMAGSRLSAMRSARPKALNTVSA